MKGPCIVEWVRTLGVPGSGRDIHQKLKHVKRFFVNTELSLGMFRNQEGFLVDCSSGYLRRAQKILMKNWKEVTFSPEQENKVVLNCCHDVKCPASQKKRKIREFQQTWALRLFFNTV